LANFRQLANPLFLNFLQKFRASIQPLPQAFFIKITGANLYNIPQYEEEQNVQTNETLAIMRNHRM
jgi:hypothetical protein